MMNEIIEAGNSVLLNEQAVKDAREREMDCAIHTYRYVRHADR